jgi:predicted XRE-type DNA-binding protein
MSTIITGRLVLPSTHDDERLVEREPSRRPARVAQLLALAHRWQRQIDGRDVASQKDMAEREGVTAARVSQVMRLLCLAPEIQERVLMMEAVDGVEPMAERALRSIAGEVDWRKQVASCRPSFVESQAW